MTAPRVSVFGEALFDMIETADGQFVPHVGGSPFNVCRGFARLGLQCDYLSPISFDRLGERIADAAAEEGISIARVPRSDKPTSLALVTIDEGGQPSYRLYRQGVADLDIDAATLMVGVTPDCQLFHTGSLALVPEMEAVLSDVIGALRQRGVPISIDANLRKGVVADTEAYLSCVHRLIERATVLKVSDEDLALLGITDPLPFCRNLVAEEKVALVAYTEGAAGATLVAKNGEVSAPAHLPDPVGDTVGAGDTFFSALLSYLVRSNAFETRLQSLTDVDLQNALQFSQQAASINVGRKGCNPPSLQEVQAALQLAEAS